MKQVKTAITFNYRYRDPCSASINEDDLHTTKLIGDGNKKVSNTEIMLLNGSINHNIKV